MTRIWCLAAWMMMGSMLLAAEGQPESKPAAPASGSRSKEEMIDRGRYLTHDVAMCIICHSPRKPDGTLIREQLFHGAPIPVRSPFENQDWATRSPDLTAIPEIWGEEELARFLQTGTPPRGAPPRLPMPPFRMSEEDARAVAAYLGSLR